MNNKRNKSPLGRIAFISVAAILIISLLGGVLAKYVHDNNAEELIYAPLFYFNSDKLSVSGETYNLQSTVDSFTFSLGNNQDELRISEVDINYTVSVTTSDADFVLKINGSVATGGTLTAGNTPDVDTVTIEGLDKGVAYTITVTGTAGYSKTITATVTRANDDVIFYKYLDKTNYPYYVELVVYTQNVTGTISAEYEGKHLIPDNNQDELENINNFEGGQYVGFNFTDNNNFKNISGSGYAYRFLIDPTKSESEYEPMCNIDLFTVTLNDGSGVPIEAVKVDYNPIINP